jgi:hypothetical protein
MATTPPFQTKVKNGKVYHVYPHHKFRFIRNVGQTSAQAGADKQGQALLDAIGLTGGDSKNILKAAQTMSQAKLQGELAPIDQAETNLAGQNSYLSQRTAKYGQIYQNAVNQTAQQAAAANTAPQLTQASGNAALDDALRNSIAARSQGYAANAATAAQVAPMRFADQQQQLAQQFQGQMAQLQQKRLQTQQGAAGDYLSTLTDLGQKQVENQMASQALGLKTDIAQATAQHQHNQDVTAAASVKERAQAAANSLTSQELRQKRQLDAAAKQGNLNRTQKARLAALDRKVKIALHNSDPNKSGTAFLPGSQQNTVTSKIKGIASDITGHKSKFKNRAAAAAAYEDAHPGTDMDYLSAALDLAYNGVISNGTAVKLHKRGIRVAPIGPGTPNPYNSPAAQTGGN